MKRPGLTLLEMVVSLASSTVLVAGLASALYISSQALPENDNPMRQSSRAAAVVREVVADVGLALSFSERTARAITFTVPDRNDDNSPETIRYAWSGTVGDPLTYQYNGSIPPVTIAFGVQNFNLETLTRELLPEAAATTDVSKVVFEEFVPIKNNGQTGSTATSVVTTIAKPSGTIEGSLLIAAVAVDGSVTFKEAELVVAGWKRIPTATNSQLTFGVWWKMATALEPTNYPFGWNAPKQSYAWIMRFSGHDVLNPINAYSTPASGVASYSTIPSPAVTTTVPNAMILRLGGFDGQRIPNLLLHDPITMDKSSNSILSACAGGAGYKPTPQETTDSSGTSNFALSSASPATEEYTTVTIAIAPAAAE